MPLSYSSLKKLNNCLIFYWCGALAVRAVSIHHYTPRRRTLLLWSASHLTSQTNGIASLPRDQLIRRKEESSQERVVSSRDELPDQCRLVPTSPAHLYSLNLFRLTRTADFRVVFIVGINPSLTRSAAQAETQHLDVLIEKLLTTVKLCAQSTPAQYQPHPYSPHSLSLLLSFILHLLSGLLKIQAFILIGGNTGSVIICCSATVTQFFESKRSS